MSTSRPSSCNETDECPALSPPPIPSTSTIQVSEMTPTTVVPPPPFTRASTIRKPRGGRYTQWDLVTLFTTKRTIILIGPYEWEQVNGKHSQQYPGHDIESLRFKYMTTHRRKVPTGIQHVRPMSDSQRVSR